MSEHYDFHYQPTGSGAISGQQVLQQTEDAINELGDYVNDNVGGAMDVAQQALETAQNAETNAQTALNTANSFSSAIQSAQQDASTALSTAQTAQNTASNANNTAIQAQQDASSAVTTANNASGQVSTLSGTVTALGQRVTTAEGNIGQNTSDITALTNRVGTAEGNITTLQNDVTIAQGNASSAMATAGTVKQQAYVFRYSSTALVASSTNSNTLLDNTDNLKVGDKVIDSDGVLFSVTAIDTANSTFTIGTALVDLAQDSDVVHKSGNETISGNKTFSSRAVFNSPSKDGELTLRQNAYDPATNGQSALSSTCGFTITARTVTNGSFAQIGFYGAPGFTTTRLNCRYYTGAGESEESWVEYTVVGTSGSITGRSFKPCNNGRIDLGTNTNRWKSVYSTSINSLEPSSLSLPSDRSARIDISSYITNLGDGNFNTYTVPANGYIWLSFIGISRLLCYSKTSDELTNYAQTFARNGGDGLLNAFFPVRKNDNFIVQISTSSTAVVQNAYFIPCQGNI